MMENIPRIAVVGGWHQASVVAACFADLGYEVRGVGEEAAAVAALNAGRAPVHEPGLDDLLRRNLAAGRLRFTTDYADGLAGADYAYICIDTPVGPDDESDLAPIDRAVEEIATHASGSLILCVSAQVPVGTCDRYGQLLASRRPLLRLPVVYVPEFLRLGSAVQTFREADRFVVGSDDPTVAAKVAALYDPLERPVRITGLRSAEVAKHASNAFLATSISFINQLADLCQVTGADVTEVAEVMKLDRRIGPHAYLSPGLGYAGGTLGREIRALRALGKAKGVDTTLFAAVEAVNLERVPQVKEQLKRHLTGLRGQRIAVLGLTYKAGTSTLRRSAALQLIELLQAEGARIAAFDPLANLEELPERPGFEVCADPLSAAKGASALVLVAPWAGIDRLDLQACAQAMQQPLFLDTGNFLAPERARKAGLTYVGVGRGGAGSLA